MGVWIEPKTDWTLKDYFNVADWDRIRGNYEYLKDIAKNYFEHFELDPTENKTVTSWLLASDLNRLEQNLEKLNTLTENMDLGETKVFVAGGKSIDYVELNRIERACLYLYRRIHRQANEYMFCGNELFGGEPIGII